MQNNKIKIKILVTIMYLRSLIKITQIKLKSKYQMLHNKQKSYPIKITKK